MCQRAPILHRSRLIRSNCFSSVSSQISSNVYTFRFRNEEPGTQGNVSN